MSNWTIVILAIGRALRIFQPSGFYVDYKQSLNFIRDGKAREPREDCLPRVASPRGGQFSRVLRSLLLSLITYHLGTVCSLDSMH